MYPDSTWLIAVAAVAAAYAIGSLTSAVVVSRALGLPDPRYAGSKNPGATNVLRLGGKLPAALTLIADVLKGTLPVAVAMLWLSGWPLMAVAAAPFLGHLFPLYSGLRNGGKGVATGLGVYIALAPPVAGSLVATWLAVAALTRYSSLSALAAAVSVPLWSAFWYPGSTPLLGLGVVLAVLLVYRHKDNIARLLRGEESRIGDKSKTA
ncbi:acyl-phosphate glycerol-3-phosphate acyltransferase [Thiohalorhabdus denitrificans]|uniref:Glycerol-3-phosphate acyltransferase n=1 Tax=Thiohalorhabdus denitrificans TaxID=381306 RepID=A0A1G5FRM5_9GAMM|nr:acyl-phosphate glycerol-3-phosphate acyltransferase [Thiohalorhabdus denitrificans]